ncbi:peptide-N-glycosidase [Puteibacter caeruleilacunae]|nr:peptide-N-glycosidase [Puteibacter caeruleilacunae]
MKKLFVSALLVGALCNAFNVKAKPVKEKAGTVVYQMISHGKPIPQAGETILKYANGVAVVERKAPKEQNLIPEVPKEKTIIDFSGGQAYQLAKLMDGSLYHTAKQLSDLPKPKVTDETEEILGYNCKKATIVLFSNRIDLWFTTEAGIKGAPSVGSGLTDGVVLKMVRNGSYGMLATKIDLQKKSKEELMPTNLGALVNGPVYQSKLKSSYIKSVEVFDREQISWGNEINNPEGEVLDAIYKYAGGTLILKKVKLPKVTDDYDVFAEIVQYSNGDAYDRTGSIFMIPQDRERSFLDGLQKGVKTLPEYKDVEGKAYQGVVATDDYLPVLEMVRFFTSFGVRAFNEKRTVVGQQWEDSTIFKQDISYLLPKLQGEVWIGAFIGNYDKGGHKLSLKLNYYPGSRVISEEPEKKKWVLPLFNTCNVMEMAGQSYGTMFKGDSLKVGFTIPEGVKNVRLEYISTGHGGWGGGDEFNQKMNEIFVDGDKVFGYIPWRRDCGTYRNSNPSSGNFWNGISSSDLSRSGWCPATLTNPVTVPFTGIEAGKHTIQVAIPIGPKEGGSSSSWNISGVLVGEYE